VGRLAREIDTSLPSRRCLDSSRYTDSTVIISISNNISICNSTNSSTSLEIEGAHF